MRTLPIALLLIALPLSGAQGAIWAWGCQGQLGDEQLIFNRYNMVIFKSGGWKLGDVKRLINDDIKTPPDTTVDRYDPQNTNEAFEYATIEFLGKDDPKRKVTLTEKSSKRLSHRHKNVGGRDEDVDTYRKVYAFKRGDEPFRDIAMQCIEYQLSTCGGRCK
jgi:hypothetical protein